MNEVPSIAASANPGGNRRSALHILLLIATYVTVFGLILLDSHGIPYAIDNNESFSTLWHARHLYDTSFTKTKGLADEVFAWNQEASPFVHSHQGNFPRLFAFLIYLVGLRSIESQTIAVTFTVGLLGVILAYRVFRCLGPPTFALLGSVILITDYALVGQWQTNTHRVWTEVFFFGSLLWSFKAAEKKGTAFFLTGVAVFASVFYGENVFAAFIGISAFLLGVLFAFKRPRALLRISAAIFVGGSIASAVLIAQLVAYMGWDGLKQDLRLTTAARNMASDQAFADKADQFYQSHKIIFWHNFYDVSTLRSISAFCRSFLQDVAQFYTPWVVVAATVVLIGASLGYFFPHISMGNARAGAIHPVRQRSRWITSLACVALLSLSLACIGILPRQFDSFSTDLFQKVWLLTLPSWSVAGFGLLCALFGVLAQTNGTNRPDIAGLKVGRLCALSLCIVAAYAVTYRIFTGYVFSGYLDRGAPMLAYWTDMLFAAAIFVPANTAWRAFSSDGRELFSFSIGTIGAVIAVLFGAFWILAQGAYLRIAPPTGESFIRELAHREYRGGSFATTGYPAQVAEKTHAWARADSTIFTGRVELGSNGFKIESDPTYLWFADANASPKYSKPEFGLMSWQPANLRQALQYFGSQARDGYLPNTLNGFGLLQRAREPIQPFVADHVVSTDNETYAIVRFDWDFPPFLRPLFNSSLAASRLSLEQKLSFANTAYLQRRRWRIAITPIPEASNHPGITSIEIPEASIDGNPLFHSDSVEGLGWTSDQAALEFNSNSPHTADANLRPIETIAVGERISLRLATGPSAGRVNVVINDVDETLDLRKPQTGSLRIELNANQPHGRFTSIPSAPPGEFVNTWLVRSHLGSAALIEYQFVQQDGKPEDGTILRLYNEAQPDHWHLLDEIDVLSQKKIPVRLSYFRKGNPDTVNEFNRVRAKGDTRTYLEWLSAFLADQPSEWSRTGVLDQTATPSTIPPDFRNPHSEYVQVPLPNYLSGMLQFSVTPRTKTKIGPEFFGAPFKSNLAATLVVGRFTPVSVDASSDRQYDVDPFGSISIRLRFPSGKTQQAEPIVSTGSEGAGDFIYVIYSDSSHIRVGFDHWFRGGVITPPISLDYGSPHDLEISMGSLYPSEDGVLFAGLDRSLVESLKHRVTVKLDGQVIIDNPAEFWDSAPQQVTIGINSINGTTSNPRFTGTILACKRVWPASLH